MAIPIYVIGSSNTDMVVTAEKLPIPGETVLGGSFLMNPGGKGANQAVAAARLGGKVTFIAKVGNDIFGKQAVQQFQKENIDTTFVTIDHQHPSGVALIGVDANGENNVIVAPGANSHIDQRVVEQALDMIKGDGIVLLQLEIPLTVVEHAIKKAYEKGLLVILNPSPVQKLQPELLQQLYLITPNDYEAEMLTGVQVTDFHSAKRAARQLLEKGVPNVVMSLSPKEGAFLLNSSEEKLVPAPPVSVIDITASRDCFNGALAVALSEKKSLENAVSFANKAASVSVTRMGAQSSLPYRKEVDGISFFSVL